MRWSELKEEACPLARGLAVVGDRWTMLILRDCFFGASRFEEFQKSLGMTRHVLSDRLKKLEAEGVLERVAYQQRPLRCEYRLTEAGRALLPVLVTLVDWAQRHGPRPGPDAMRMVDRETGAPLHVALMEEGAGKPLDPARIRFACDPQDAPATPEG